SNNLETHKNESADGHAGGEAKGPSAVSLSVPHVSAAAQTPAQICLLPGPVAISPGVRKAFHEPPIYHRGPEFIGRFIQVQANLGAMVNGRDVAILNGSGTLANECVAATLAADSRPGRGVLLING